MTKDEALKLALEWFEKDGEPDHHPVVTAIREALAEPEIPMQNNNPGLEWDKIPKSFDDWWDSDYDPTGNPFQHETPAYWAWAGWKASSVATNDTSHERVDETSKQRHKAQPEHSCVACEGNPKGNNNPCAVCGMAQPEQEPVAIKHMAEWVEYLKRQSDHGQHLRIPSGMSAGTCWDLARELEQFINTTPPQRKPLSNQKIIEMYNEPRSDAEMIEFARAIEAAHGIWPENSDCYGSDWTDRDGEYLK